jgi:hypothetical protein
MVSAAFQISRYRPLWFRRPLAAKVGSPTGQVFNGSATDFRLAPGFPSKFIFATLDGTISGWNLCMAN